MNNKFLYSLCGALFFLSIIFFAWFNEYIIINPRRSLIPETQTTSATKKKVTLYFYKNDWQQDCVHLLLSENDATNAQLIIGRWLEIAFEESVIAKKTIAQSAFITASDELIISFDRTLFSKESSTFEKWMLIEAILKSVHDAIPGIKSVRFLINHQTINDPHLDFINAWPSKGFA
jgi:Sporulation and spore germination